MKKRLAIFSCIAATVVMTAVLWRPPSEDRVTVALTNVGTQAMHGVVVHITGAAYPVGAIEPGHRVTVDVTPKADTHVEIEQASGQRLIVDCYFAAGYSGTVAVKLNSAKVIEVKSQVTS